jgi:hypothetical protein
MGQCLNTCPTTSSEITSNRPKLQNPDLIRRIQAVIRAHLGRKSIKILKSVGGAGKMAHKEKIEPLLSSDNEKVKVKLLPGN